MRRICLFAISLCLGTLSALAQPKVEHLGPLQGENAGKSGYAYQGMDIYGNYMLSCQNQGIASIYRLSGKKFELLGQFHMESFHEYNHANVASFGTEKAVATDPLPVAYISQCSKYTVGGMKDVLYAERIMPDFKSSKLLQTIFYDDVNKDFGYALQWVIDRENNMLYGYGNTVNNTDPDNRHRIIKFRLPKLSDGPLVVLKPEDALENYRIEDLCSFRLNPIGQGLFIEKGKLYMPTGFGRIDTPSVLYIWDLTSHRMQGLDLSLVSTGEFEDISRYGKWFYIQGQDGIFRIKASDAVGKEDFGWTDLLPRPVFEARPGYIDLYDKAWELAYNHIDTLKGIPSPVYMDEAHRSDRIWIWDTCFMGHFCKYCPAVFPGTASLDNFYKIMLSDESSPLPEVKGNIWCGKDEGKMLKFRIHHPDNPPLFAWTEYEYAMQIGSKSRLKTVFKKDKYLQKWFDMFDSFDPDAPKPHGSSVKVALKKYDEGYAWAGCPSGMDNTPRGRVTPTTPNGACPDNPDLRWLDALAQQGLSALYMSRIASILQMPDDEALWKDRHSRLSAQLNELYWDEKDGFYYDILRGGEKNKVRTIASWWPLMAEMAPAANAGRMMPLLRSPEEFGGMVPTPSLSRSDADFVPDGGYWRGGVWLPTSYMTLKAIDVAGDYALSREVGSSILEHMYRTYTDYDPHTVWECYSPSAFEPARNKKGKVVRPDFCGWSALGPISVFIEDVIGIKQADGFNKTLICDFDPHPKGKTGVRDYRFGKVVCNIIVTEKKIEVESNRPFTLMADGKTFSVLKGKNSFSRK